MVPCSRDEIICYVDTGLLFVFGEAKETSVSLLLTRSTTFPLLLFDCTSYILLTVLVKGLVACSLCSRILFRLCCLLTVELKLAFLDLAMIG